MQACFNRERTAEASVGTCERGLLTGPMSGSERQEIEITRRVLHDAEGRAHRHMELATAMEWVGDRLGADNARELLRIEYATIKLARDRLRHLEYRHVGDAGSDSSQGID